MGGWAFRGLLNLPVTWRARWSRLVLLDLARPSHQYRLEQHRSGHRADNASAIILPMLDMPG